MFIVGIVGVYSAVIIGGLSSLPGAYILRPQLWSSDTVHFLPSHRAG